LNGEEVKVLEHPWFLEESEDERDEQNIFRKCCFILKE
jgi:hypothetical protein